MVPSRRKTGRKSLSGPGFEMKSLDFVNGPQFKGHLLEYMQTGAFPFSGYFSITTRIVFYKGFIIINIMPRKICSINLKNLSRTSKRSHQNPFISKSLLKYNPFRYCIGLTYFNTESTEYHRVTLSF